MLQRLIALRNVGRFRNRGEAGDVTFRRYTLIFVENRERPRTLRFVSTNAPTWRVEVQICTRRYNFYSPV